MANSSSKQHIAVIGAGLVGLSCALWLKRKGFRVSVIDPEPPGSGTSSGNACSIAEYACIPVNSPDLFRNLPSLMLSKESPLTVNRLYALRHPLWMLDFLRHCRPAKVAHIIQSLGGLLTHTWDGLAPLLDMTGARDLVVERGFLQVHRNKQEFDLSWPSNRKRTEQGVKFTKLGAGEIRDLEPNLKIPFEYGLLFEGVHQVLDPLVLCQRYAEHLLQNDVQFIRQKVVSLHENGAKVTLALDNGESLTSDQAIVAAGAFSRFINGLGKLSRKLDTERGYHVLYREHQQLLSRPVSWHSAGFYATPMNLGLRIAGTVEIAGFHQQQNPRNTTYLARKASQMFDVPDTPHETWLGFRPTFPDSLPAIGYSGALSRIIVATGHQHIGLSLAGITGRLVSELASGEDLIHDIAPFNPLRF